MALNTKFNAKNGISVGIPSVSLIDNVGNAIFPTVSARQYLGLQPSLSGLAALVGGNSLGSALTIGTNDNYDLNLETGGSTRMTVTNAGNVGIGTALPVSPLHIVSGVNSNLYLGTSATNDGIHEIRFGFIPAPTNSYAASIVGIKTGGNGRGNLEFRVAGGVDSTNAIQSDTGLRITSVEVQVLKPLLYAQDVLAIGDNYNSGVKAFKFTRSENKAAIWSVPVGGYGNGDIRFTTGNEASATPKTESDATFIISRNGGVVIGNSYIAQYPTNGNLLVQNSIGIGTSTPVAKLDIADTTLAGSGALSGSALNIAQTWNTTGNPTAIKLNVTNTSSGAASNLLDLQVGGVSKLYVDKSGMAIVPDSATSGGFVFRPGNSGSGGIGYLNGGGYGVWAGAGAAIGFSTGAALNGNILTALYTDGANTLAQRNSTAPQELRVYRSYTDASNYERFSIRTNTGTTSATQIGLSAAGTGQNRDLEIVTGGSTRMTVTSAGFVGIGTTAPSSILDINDSNGSQKSVVLSLRNGSFGWWVMTSSNSNTSGFLRFSSNNSGLIPLTLNGDNGNVGIGATTPAARLDIADTTLAGSGSLAGSILNLAQTWNTTGAPTAIKLNVTNTASGAASNLLDLQVDTTSKFKVGKGATGSANMSLGSSGGDCTFSTSGNLLTVGLGSHDVQLCGSLQVMRSNLQAATFFLGHNDTSTSLAPALLKDGNYILAQRNGINPQIFRVYNTYSSSTNFERAILGWDSNIFYIGTEKGSAGGAATPIQFYTNGIPRMVISSGGLVTVRDETGTQQRLINNFTCLNNSYGGSTTTATPWLLDAATNNILHNYSTRLTLSSSGSVAASGVYTQQIDWPLSELTDVNGMVYAEGIIIVRCYYLQNAASVRVRYWNNFSSIWTAWATAIDITNDVNWGVWRASVGGNYMTKLQVETTSPPGNSVNIQNIEYYPTRSNSGIRYPHMFAAQGASKLLIGGGKSTHAAIVGSGNILKIRNGNDSADGSITAAAATFSTTLSVAGISNFSTAQLNSINLVRGDGSVMSGALTTSTVGGDFVALGNSGNSNGTNIYGNSTNGIGVYVGSSVDLLKPTALGRLNGTTSNTDLSIYNTSSGQTKIGIKLGNSSTSSGSNIAINFVDYTDTAYSQIRGVYNGAIQTGQLAFLTANGGALAETLRITNTGNVGIGTITPNEKLTVVGVISSSNVVYASGGNSNLWNSAYSSVNTISANGATTFTTVNTNSSNWSNAYTTTNANSANWSSVYSTTNANSANWSSVYTTTNTNSASWSSVYSSYNAASATILKGTISSTGQGNITIPRVGGGNESVTISELGTSGNPTFNNLTVSGNLSVVGDFTYLNTGVSVTSALSVVNTGTGPALVVRQSGTTPIAHFIDADGTGDIIFDNNGFVGLGTATPNQRLTVVGGISSTNVIYASGGNSNLWNSAYTAVTAISSNSANYILDGGNTKGTNLLVGTNDNFNLNLETAGTTKMTVTSAGNVGIGTTSPTGKLTIDGSIVFTGTASRTISAQPATSAGTGPSITIRSGDSSSGGAGGDINLVPGVGQGGPGSGQINLGSSTLGLAQYINLNAYTTTINSIGPNTGTPLIVNGGGRVLMSFNWDNINNVTLLNSSVSSSIRLSGALDYQISGSNSLSSRFALNVSNSSGTSISYFRNDGNVGIGTITPTARLDVADTTLAGSGALSGSALSIAQTWNTTGNPTAITLNVTNSASGAASNLLDLQVGGSSRFSVRRDGTVAGWQNSIFGGGFGNLFSGRVHVGDYNFSVGSTTLAQIAIEVDGADAANALILNRDAGVWWSSLASASNVGLLRLATDLALRRDGSNILAQRNGVNPQAFRLYNTFTDTVSAFERLNIKWDTNVIKIGTEKGITGGLGRAMEFQTDGTTRMTVTSAGNIGIGTTTPTSKLEIVDTTSAISLSGAALNIAHTWNAPGVDVTAIKLNVSSSASGANSKLIDLQIGGTSYFNVDKAGATTMASAVFVTGGNSNLWNSNYTTTNTNSARWASAYTTTNTNSANWSSVYTTVNANSASYIVNGGNTLGSAITIGTNDANNFNLETSGTARVSISSTGQVGIGTTTPDADLVVYKNVTGAPTTLKIRTASSTASRLDFYRTDAYVATRFDVLSTNEFQFYNNNDVATPKYIINGTNGNFGIGTTSTAQKVTIGGSLSASGSLYGERAILGDTAASVYLERDAINALGIRNSTAAQTLNVYGTYTSSTNFERLTLAASSLGGVIGHYAGGGGGVARDLLFQTSGTTRMTIAAAGSVNVAGHFSAATKSFLIDHPTQEGKKLQYGVVESNQHSVLVRGKTSESIIELPEEWSGLVHENSVTVQLTPIGSYQQLFVISQDNQRVVVGGSTGQYNYTIYGERKDVDKLITEI